jgi:hypothetical protein
MEEERVSSGLSVLEMNQQRKKITVVGQAWRYKYSPSPMVVYGWHCRPSQNRKNQDIFGWLFWLGMRMLF